MRRRHVKLAVVPFCILIVVLSWTPPAVAQVSEEDDANLLPAEESLPFPEDYEVLPATRHQHVAGSAFVPLYGDAGVTYGSKGCTYMTNASHAFMNYSLDLPSGSTVTYLRLYFNDTAATDGTLHLAQYDDGAAYEYLATVQTSGSAGLGSSTVSGLSI
jgi:hypothetical protein